MLGKEAFGEYAIVQSSVALFGIFAGMAMGITSTKYVAQFRKEDPERAGRFIGIPLFLGLVSSTAAMFILILFADIISDKLLSRPDLGHVVRLSSPLLIFNTIANIQMASLAGFEAFRGLAVGRAALGLSKLPCQTLGVLLWGLKGAVVGLIIADLISCIILGIYLNRHCRLNDITISCRKMREEMHELFHFSLPSFLAGLSVGPTNWLCNVLLVNTSNGYEQMGLFNATFQWQSAVRFIPLRMFDVSLPILSNLHGEKDHKRYYKVFLSTLFSIVAFTLLLAVPIIIMSKFIMSAYGSGFTEGANVLAVMVAASVVQMVARIFSQYVQSRGKAWIDFAFCLMRTILLLILWIFNLRHGAFGLAFSILCSYLFMTFGLFVYFLISRRSEQSLKQKGLQCESNRLTTV